MDQRLILTLSCRDTVGIVAAVTGMLARHGAFIVESQQYADLGSGRFFARIEVTNSARDHLDLAELREAFRPVAEGFDMDWRLTDSARKPRTLVMVSRFGHCLNDLLHRWRTGTLPVELVGVCSNHDDCRAMVEWHGVPYFTIPVTPGEKGRAEAALVDRAAALSVELLVLARYMQVLSPELCAHFAGRAINIHHSFLPSFKGARPYHQAHERGVKLIGATAHFVTPDLDDGPIIEQATERVEHWHTPDDLVRIGRDIEAQVLARAVAWVAEERVLLNGRRTVIFRR